MYNFTCFFLSCIARLLFQMITELANYLEYLNEEKDQS